MSTTFTISVVLGLSVLVLFTARSLLRRKPLGRLPPGPRRKPIVGNIADLPPAGIQEWVHWGKFKEYGMYEWIKMAIDFDFAAAADAAADVFAH